MQLDKNIHILVVDDQEPSRVLSRLRLQELGFKKIHEAEDGMEALEYLAESYKAGDPVRLVLCDHEMPEVDGFQVFRVVRQTEAYHDLAFLMVTAHSEPELIAAMINRDIRHFIVKPISAQVLGEKLVKMLLREG